MLYWITLLRPLCDKLSNIDWWLTFLPHFNGSAMIALRPCDFHIINALELFVLLMAVKIWASKLAGSIFQISWDNDAAVKVVRSGRTRDAFMQCCLRQHPLVMIWTYMSPIF